MGIEDLAEAAALASPLAAGAALVRLLGVGRSGGGSPDRAAGGSAGWAVRCALAYVLGSLVTGALVLCLIPLPGALARFGVTAVISTSILLVAWAVAARRRPEVVAPAGSAATTAVVPPEAAPPRRSVYEVALFWTAVATAVAVAVASALVENVRPIIGGDEGVIWASKAAALWRAAAGDREFLRIAAEQQIVQHADYPILNPLLQDWAFAVRGAVTHVLNRVPMQAAIAATALFVAGSLRDALRPAAAAMLVLLCVPDRANAVIGAVAGADAMVGLGFAVMLECWRRFASGGGPAWLRMCALAAAFTLWSKNEGMMLVAAFAVSAAGAAAADSGLRRSLLRGRGILWAAAPLAVLALTLEFNARFGFRSDLLGDNPEGRNVIAGAAAKFQERAGVVALRIAKDVLVSPSTRFVWPAFVLLAACGGLRAAGRGAGVCASTILIGAAAYACVFVGTYWPLDRHMDTALARVFRHLWPAALLLVGRMLAARMPAWAASASAPAPTPRAQEAA